MTRHQPKPPAVARGIKCKKCGRVEPGHNAANCAPTPEQRALAARGGAKR